MGVTSTGFFETCPGVFQKRDETWVVFRRGLGQGEKACGLRSRQGADNGPVSFAHAIDARGAEGDGIDGAVQVDVEPGRKNVGQIIISLQNVKARAEGAADELVFPVENWRDDGAKLAEVGEEFFFEIGRLRREVLHAMIDEMTLPKPGGASSSNNRGLFKNMDANASGAQGLRTTQAGKSCSDNRDRFFHRGNLVLGTLEAIDYILFFLIRKRTFEVVVINVDECVGIFLGFVCSFTGNSF